MTTVQPRDRPRIIKNSQYDIWTNHNTLQNNMK